MNSSFQDWVEKIQNQYSVEFYFFGKERPAGQCRISKPKIGFFPGQSSEFIKPTAIQQEFLLTMDHIITTDYHTQQVISKYNNTSVMPPCIEPTGLESYPHTKEKQPRILIYLDKKNVFQDLDSIWEQIRSTFKDFDDIQIFICSREIQETHSNLRGLGGLETNQYRWFDFSEKDPYLGVLTLRPDIIVYPYHSIPPQMGFLFCLSQYLGIAWIAPTLPLYQEMMSWGSLYSKLSGLSHSILNILQANYPKKQSSQLKAQTHFSCVTHPDNIQFSIQHIIKDIQLIRIAVVLVETKHTENSYIKKVATMTQQTYCLLQKYPYFQSIREFESEEPCCYDFIWYVSPYTFILQQDFLIHKYLQSYLKSSPGTTHWIFKSSRIEKVHFKKRLNATLPIHRPIESLLVDIKNPVDTWFHPGDFSCDLASLLQYPNDIANKKLNHFIDTISSLQFQLESKIFLHFTGKTVIFQNKAYLLLPYYELAPSGPFQWQIQHGHQLMIYHNDTFYPQALPKNHYVPTPSYLPNDCVVMLLPHQESLPKDTYHECYTLFARKYRIPYQFTNISTQSSQTFRVPDLGFFIHKDLFSDAYQELVEMVEHPFHTDYYLITSDLPEAKQIIKYLFYSFYPQNKTPFSI